LRLNAQLVRAKRAEADAKEVHSRAERKLGLARRAEGPRSSATCSRAARRE
jgi:hypothetical protein